MRLDFNKDNTVTVSNGGQELVWDVSVYDRTRLKDVSNVFRETNQFFEKMSATAQKQVFEKFSEIYQILESIHEPNRLAIALINAVAQLYEIIPYELFDHWYRYHGKVTLPDNLKENYDPEDPPERTYLRADYIKLAILTIALRPMVPIWGEYIRRIKNSTGSEYKEYAAMRLLGKSKGIMTCEPMVKLTTYIQKSITNGYDRAVAAIFSGLGSAEIPEYMLSLIIVRRLVVGDVHASEERGNIISNIYGFMTGVVKDFDRKFGGGINEKHREDDPIDDDTMSLVEAYKVKQEVPAGEIKLLAAYASRDPVSFAQSIDPTITAKMVNQCVRDALRNQDIDVQRFQEVLCQWIVKPVMSPMGVTYLNKEPMLRVMGIVQAVLWHWGFHNLAALMTAKLVPLPEDTMMATETRMRIPTQLTDRLVELYPCTHPATDSGNDRKQNVGAKAVRAVAKEISGRVYQLTCSSDLMENCTAVDSKGKMPSPSDLAESISLLAIKIAEER